VTGTVYVVEDDAAVRDALAQLLESKRFRVKVFESAERFPRPARPGRGRLPPALDLRLPGMSGIKLQGRWPRAASTFPSSF
jgi:FixJ family two-component response regulator